MHSRIGLNVILKTLHCLLSRKHMIATHRLPIKILMSYINELLCLCLCLFLYVVSQTQI